MRLVPLGDRVVLKELKAEETTKSGIVLPDRRRRNRSRLRLLQWDREPWKTARKLKWKFPSATRLSIQNTPEQM